MTVEALTAAAIAQLAFEAVIQSGAGKFTEAALAKGKQLWQKIRGKLKEDPAAEAALVEVERHKSEEILAQQVVPFLQVAMLKDPQFAQDIENIAQQINLEIHSGNQEQITMNVTARDNAAVIGIAKGETQFFGGTHTHEKK
jgi:hypothetical protein